jgi:hypothetical protein
LVLQLPWWWRQMKRRLRKIYLMNAVASLNRWCKPACTAAMSSILRADPGRIEAAGGGSAEIFMREDGGHNGDKLLVSRDCCTFAN